MKWTTEHPTKAGYYWYRDDHRAVVLQVFKGVEKDHWFAWGLATQAAGSVSIAEYPGQWWGPFKEPR